MSIEEARSERKAFIKRQKAEKTKRTLQTKSTSMATKESPSARVPTDIEGKNT